MRNLYMLSSIIQLSTYPCTRLQETRCQMRSLLSSPHVLPLPTTLLTLARNSNSIPLGCFVQGLAIPKKLMRVA